MAMMILDKDKYKATFLYMLQALDKIEGKKKACKLFYFLDFDYYIDDYKDRELRKTALKRLNDMLEVFKSL